MRRLLITWSQNKWFWMGLSAAAMMVLIVIVIQSNQLQSDLDNAETAQYDANTSVANIQTQRSDDQHFLTSTNALLLAKRAYNTYQDGDTGLALALAVESASVDNPPALEVQQNFAEIAFESRLSHRTDEHRAVHDLALSPDGNFLLIAMGESVILRNIATGEDIYQMDGHTEIVSSVAFSPNSWQAISGSHDGNIILWDLATGNRIYQMTGHIGQVYDLVFMPDGIHFVSVGGGWRPESNLGRARTGEMILWDITTADEIRRFAGHEQPIDVIAINPDGTQMLTSSSDLGYTNLILWDVATGQELRRLQRIQGRIKSIAFTPEGHWAVTGIDSWSGVPQLIQWDLETGEEYFRYGHHTAPITQLRFSNDGSTMLSGDAEGNIIEWRLNDRMRQFYGYQRTYRAGLSAVNSLLIGPNNQWIIASGGASLYRWDLHDGITNWQQDGQYIAAQFSNDRSVVHTAAWDGTISTIDVSTGTVLSQFNSFTGVIQDIRFTPNHIVGIVRQSQFEFDQNEQIIVWDTQTHEPLAQFVVPPYFRSLGLTPDGSTFIVGNNDYTITAWRIDPNQTELEERWHSDRTYEIFGPPTFSTAGDMLLAVAEDGLLELLDTDTGQQIRRLNGQHQNGFNPAKYVFSPDDSLLISISVNSPPIETLLWDVETGTVLERFTESTGTQLIGFTDDGQKMILYDGLWTVTLRDLASGENEYLFVDQPLNTALDLYFDDDTRLALQIDHAWGPLKLWKVRTFDELMQWTVNHRYIPEFSCEQRIAYQIEPFCTRSADGTLIAYTRTPFPTQPASTTPPIAGTLPPLPSLTITSTFTNSPAPPSMPTFPPTFTPSLTLTPSVTIPMLDLPTLTPSFTPSPITPTVTRTPSSTPTFSPPVSLEIGDTIQQVASVGVRYVWEFEGNIGDLITLQNNSTGMVFEIFTSDGELLIRGEVGSSLESVPLPTTGTYILLGYADQYGGLYSFTLSVSAAEDGTIG